MSEHVPPTTADSLTTSRSASLTGFDLYWLSEAPAWYERLKALKKEKDSAEAWTELVSLANTRMDFVRTGQLDRILTRLFGDAAPTGLATAPVRLAVLGSSTVAHLLPSIRIAALRRGIWVVTYEAEYGQYLQELRDSSSRLTKFAPTIVLFAFDAYHVVRGADAAASAEQAEAKFKSALEALEQCWCLAREVLQVSIIQQSLLPVFPNLLGNNEQRLPGSAAALVERLNAALRAEARASDFDLLSIDSRAAQNGVRLWHDPRLWHRAKQEISPLAAPLYGEMVARLLAAKQGRSHKCLILDLDNTVWGGVIGDDGLNAIVIGQGSALGEAFSGFQLYVRELVKRGVILAVCSKNDETNALAPFEQHPDMVLKRNDISCFVANWNDKPSNIRAIAKRLNIGIDSMVFVDDNPFERNLVRQELPTVAVPEIPDDPALVATCIADAGYFEAVAITAEDIARTSQYQSNLLRESLESQSTDMESYLRRLDMNLVWRRFDRIGLQRIVQLINKTNQFNLTTRRYNEVEVLEIMHDPNAIGLQLRLLDRFGDNGIIAIIIGRLKSDKELEIDTWLMSCRVLGRQLEEATLLLVVTEARRLGAQCITGKYRATDKNEIVREHYQKLGFDSFGADNDGSSTHLLRLETYTPPKLLMTISEG